MNKIAKVMTGVVMASMLSAPVFAAKDDPMAKAVKARQGYMQVMAFNMGMLGAMAKGVKPYDAETAQMAANNLKLATQMKNGAMWPKGSGNDNPKLKTGALPKIWEPGSEIGEHSKELKMAVAGLAEVAGNGLGAMKPAFMKVGKACKGCHEDFREKKK